MTVLILVSRFEIKVFGANLF